MPRDQIYTRQDHREARRGAEREQRLWIVKRIGEADRRVRVGGDGLIAIAIDAHPHITLIIERLEIVAQLLIEQSCGDQLARLPCTRRCPCHDFFTPFTI